MLQVSPNPWMTSYDLLYKAVTHLYLHNNSYLYLQRDRGQVVGVYPLHVRSCELLQGQGGRTLCSMTFANGRSTVLDYQDIIHLRRHFNRHDVQGDPNDAITAAVSLANSLNAGMERSVRTGGSYRGIVSYAGALGASKLKAYKEAFEASELSPENAGGVVVVDDAVSFTPITENAPVINAADMEAAKTAIYNYLGISEAIVNATFDDDGFSAFDEATIEAIALQISLEATRKIYSPAEMASGRRIDVNTSRIRFIGNKTKAELLKHGVPLSVLTVNEARGMLGMEPFEDDRRVQSLNYASVSLVDEYQLYASGHGGVRMLGQQDETDEGADE